MSENTKDEGVISALLERFNQHRLPQMLQFKERVNRGEKLSDHDISFLNEMFSSVMELSPLIERNPEYKQLVAEVIDLFHEITSKALENEEKN
jgi:hypothetical protein